MTTHNQSNASTAATRAVTKILAFSTIVACMAILLMALHISSLNDRLVDNDKAWAAAAKPISDARMILPAIESPKDLASALDAHYAIMPVKTRVIAERGETEIVIKKKPKQSF